MNEDPLDPRYFAVNSPLDDQLIEKYCAGIEEQIRIAENRTAANVIINDACWRFEQKCESEIITPFLKRYVNELFEKYWGASL